VNEALVEAVPGIEVRIAEYGKGLEACFTKALRHGVDLIGQALRQDTAWKRCLLLFLDIYEEPVLPAVQP